MSEFAYYYGNQAEQFSFIRIPRVLLTEKIFEPLSIQSKLLYAVLLDRMTLSMRNEWFDEEKRVFIIYQISEIQADLGFSKRKAMDYLTELENFGLVEKKKRGFGLPSIIYVKNFITPNGQDENDNQTDQPRGSENDTSVPSKYESSSAQNGSSAPSEQGTCGAQNDSSAPSEYESCGAQNGSSVPSEQGSSSTQSDTSETTNNPDKDGETSPFESENLTTSASRGVKIATSGAENTASRGVENRTSEVTKSTPLEVSKSAPLEVRKSIPLNNKTNNNYTDFSYIESNLILSDDQKDGMRCDEKNDDDTETSKLTGKDDFQTKGNLSDTLVNEGCFDAYREAIQKNIGYESLVIMHPSDQKQLDEIVELILEVYFAQGESIVISSEKYPVALVKDRFMKLRFKHIDYILHCLSRNTSKVKNIRKYLLAALFNAPATVEGYYRAEVNHDFPGLAL